MFLSFQYENHRLLAVVVQAMGLAWSLAWVFQILRVFLHSLYHPPVLIVQFSQTR